MNLDISKRCTNFYDHFRKNDTNLNISLGAKEKFIQSFIFYECCTMNTVNENFKDFVTKSVNKAPEIKKSNRKH